MKAQVLAALGPIHEDTEALELRDLPVPEPGPGQIRIRVRACGVCHTELDEIEG